MEELVTAGPNSINLDETKQKQLLQEDEDEDFLDEMNVNPSGNSCPLALKLVACMLLLEITAFMRETYKNVPKIGRMMSKGLREI